MSAIINLGISTIAAGIVVFMVVVYSKTNYDGLYFGKYLIDFRIFKVPKEESKLKIGYCYNKEKHRMSALLASYAGLEELWNKAY